MGDIGPPEGRISRCDSNRVLLLMPLVSVQGRVQNCHEGGLGCIESASDSVVKGAPLFLGAPIYFQNKFPCVLDTTCIQQRPTLHFIFISA